MKKFLLYLTESDGRSLKVDNGVVTSSSTPTPIQTPDKWQEMIIAWERNMSRHGIVRNYSFPLAFVNDAAKIIQNSYLRIGIEREIYLLIQMLVVTVTALTYRMRYEYLYKGELDFSTYNQGDISTTINIMEGGLSKKLKANEANTYKIPFDENSIWVKMDGIIVEERANFVTVGEVDSDIYLDTHALPIAYIGREGERPGTAYFPQSVESVTPNTTAYGGVSTNYSLINSSGVAIVYRIRGKVIFKLEVNEANNAYRWFVLKSDGTLIDIYNSFTGTGIVEGGTYEIDIDTTLTLNDGEKAFFIGRFFGLGSGQTLVNFYDTSKLYITSASVPKTTYIRAGKCINVFKKLVGHNTGDPLNALSTLLELNPGTCLASAESIRGLEDAVIKTSYNNFTEAMNVRFGTGDGIEGGKVNLELKEHFYDASNPIDIGEMKDLKVTPATDLICNSIKIGYNKPDVEDINGRYDPNSSSEYTSPITRVVRTLTLISPYVTSPYEIERIRYNLEGQTTTDDKRDGKVCLLEVDLDSPEVVDGYGVVYPLKREIYDSIEGIPEISQSTIFNLYGLTPARLMKTHSNWLASIYYQFGAEKLKISTTERNSLLKTVRGSEVFDEDADINISSLGVALFKPIYFSGTTEVLPGVIELLEENTNRCFRFSHEGNLYKGFLIKCAISPATDKEQAIKLLCTADTITTNLEQ